MLNTLDETVYQMQFEPELTEREKELRIKFVDEFFYDRDPIAAAMRIGFMASFARDFAQQFMSEGFVRRLIKEREQNLLINAPEVIEDKKKRVEQGYWDIINSPTSSAPAKVAALNSLASLYNMNIKTSEEVDESTVGGVMVVPEITTADNWGAKAAEQQAKLKESVKD